MRYIALLRGINVGGNTMIKMADLKTALETLGLENVVTYVNSGNIGFDTKKTAEKSLVVKIEKVIEKGFDKSVSVMVREQKDITNIIAANPFDGEFETHKQMHVLFMREKMSKEKEDQLLEQQTEREKFAVVGREIYALLLDGVADSLLGKGFIDRKLKISVTGRNWRTVEKLAEL